MKLHNFVVIVVSFGLLVGWILVIPARAASPKIWIILNDSGVLRIVHAQNSSADYHFIHTPKGIFISPTVSEPNPICRNIRCIAGDRIFLPAEALTAEKIQFQTGTNILTFGLPHPNQIIKLDIENNIASLISTGDLQLDSAYVAGNLSVKAEEMLILDNSQLHIDGDLTLVGNILRIRDNKMHPAIVQAGGKLKLQGNQTIDIFALSHPDSVLISGQDMRLRSKNPVRGDIHYLSGGQFLVEQAAGQVGDLVSPYDPIILANGDVTLGNYSGGSLHILAGGSVLLSSALITSTDTTATTITPANNSVINGGGTTISDLIAVTLSNGTPIIIDGNATPTLDIRAGIEWADLGGTPGNQVFGSVVPVFAAANGADITVTGGITISQPSGQVLLTNQFFPNALPGDISTGDIDTSTILQSSDGGTITIDSRGTIATAALAAHVAVTGLGVIAGNGGQITLLAPNDAVTTSGDLTAHTVVPGNQSGQAGNGGDILLAAAGDITVNNGNGLLTAYSFANDLGGAGNGGTIVLESVGGDIRSGPLWAHTFAADDVAGTGGTVTVNTTGGGVTINSTIFQESVQTFALSNSGAGDGGPVVLSATEGITVAKGILAYSNGSNSNGGDVSLFTTGGPIAAEDFVTQATHPNLIGDGGNVTLQALSGGITAGNIDAYSRASALFGMASNGGQVTLEAGGGDIESGTVNSYAFATGDDSVAGNGGSITFTANGGISSGPLTAYSISADNNFFSGIAGNGGSVRLQATQNISVAGNIDAYSQAQTDGLAQNGGTIAITTTTGLIDTGNLSAYTTAMSHTLSGGDILLTAATGIVINGGAGIIDASTNSTDGSVGNGGAVTLNTLAGNLNLQRVNSSARNTFGIGSAGNGGDISLTTGNGHIHVTGSTPFVFPGLNSSLSTNDTGGTSGNVTLSATQGITVAAPLWAQGFGTQIDGGDVILTTSTGNITTTQVWAYSENNDDTVGNGGNITLQALNGGITSEEIRSYSHAFALNNPTGNGGNITIIAGNGDVVSGQLVAHSEARGEFGDTGDAGQVIVMASNGGIFVDGDVRADAFSQDNNTNSGNAGNGQGITLQATQDISVTGGLQSFARSSTFFGLPTPTGTAGNAGPVTLTANNITLSYIDARSVATGTIGSGGTVQISAGQFFSATGTLFGSADTVSTVGQPNTGPITITHGGNGVTPFIVGDATTNGVTGTLTTGDVTLNPDQSFLYTHFEAPNIWIISVPIPLTITKTAVPETDVPYRGEITYTVTITNPGSVDASNTMLTDTLPPEVDFARWIQPHGAAVASDEITWNGTVTANNTVTFSFVVSHTGNYEDVFTNTAEFLHPQSDSRGSASATVTIAGPPVLTISKMVNPDTNIAFKDEMTYTIVLSNSGQSDAEGTLLTDTLPSEVDFARWVQQPAGANVIADDLTWSGNLAVSEAVTFTFVVSHVGDYGDVFTNTVEFLHPQSASTGSATAVVTVAGQPVLSLSKVANPDTNVAYRSEMTYTIVLSNSGPNNADGTLLTDTLPSQVDFARWVQQPAGASVTNDEITWNGNVPTNNTVTFTFVVSHTGDYDDVFTNTAEFSHPGSGASSQASAQVSIEKVPPALTFSKTANPKTDVAFQGAVTYTLVLSNSGDTDATNTLLTDTLPVSTTFARWVQQPSGANNTPSQVTWNQTISANQAITFSFVVSHTGNYGDVFTNTANFSHSASNSIGMASAMVTVEPAIADLLISKSSVRDQQAGLIIYTIIVQNLGPSNADGVTVSDPIPSGISTFNWQCVASGGASCTANGSGSISDTLTNFPAGSQVVYTVTAAMVSSDATVVNTATLILPLNFTNTAPTNSAINTSNPIGNIFLPLILRGSENTPASPPDLIVDSIVADSNAVTVTVKNVGGSPVVDAFWVDVYINPNTPPTDVNQLWDDVGTQGMVWGVVAPALPLAANGGTLTLTTNGDYFYANLSSFTPPLVAPIYAQADSAHIYTTYGNVLESHEISGGAYNNINSTLTVNTASVAELTPADNRLISSDTLPPR